MFIHFLLYILLSYTPHTCSQYNEVTLAASLLTRHGVVWRVVRGHPPVLSPCLLRLLHHIVRRLCLTGSAWQYDDPVSVSVTTDDPLSPGLLLLPSVWVERPSSPWSVSRVEIRVGRDEIHDDGLTLTTASHWLSCHWPLGRHSRHGTQLYSTLGCTLLYTSMEHIDFVTCAAQCCTSPASAYSVVHSLSSADWSNNQIIR